MFSASRSMQYSSGCGFRPVVPFKNMSHPRKGNKARYAREAAPANSLYRLPVQMMRIASMTVNL